MAQELPVLGEHPNVEAIDQHDHPFAFVRVADGDVMEPRPVAKRELPALVDPVPPHAHAPGELETCNFGIICVTRANMASQWLCFEAGAISKVVEAARVAPLAIDLDRATDVSGPLSLFQVTTRSKEEIGKLLLSINASAENPLAPDAVNKALTMWWPELEKAWDVALAVDEEGASPQPARTDRDILEEILELVRQENRAFGSVYTSGIPLSNLTTVPASWVSTVAGSRRRRVPDTSDAQTVSILKQRLSERLQVPPADVKFLVLGGRVLVSLPYNPTEAQRRAVAEWASPVRA